MFPGAAAGFALIILRACAGGSLLVGAFTHGHLVVPSWTVIGVGAILLLTGAGALTPIACGVGILIEAFYLPHSVGLDLWQTALAIMIFLALALLGPGAFSVDARLFGRRLIVPHPD
jgi:hypothetical protein